MHPCLLVLKLLRREQQPLRDLVDLARGLLLLPLALPEGHPQSPWPLLGLVARGPNHVPLALKVTIISENYKKRISDRIDLDSHPARVTMGYPTGTHMAPKPEAWKFASC